MPVTLDEKKYGRLLAKYLPVVIESDEEQDRFAEVLMRLTIPPRKLSLEESRLAGLLGRLVEDYEARSNEGKTKRFSPVERLRYIMEQQGLRQVDLIGIFGSQSVVSEILSGKREINKIQARRLGERFRVSLEVFL